MLILLTAAMMLISTMISKQSSMDWGKSSPFEWEFGPKSYARVPFSRQFFLIAVIFLIFHVEITLLMLPIVTLKTFNIYNFTSIMPWLYH